MYLSKSKYCSGVQCPKMLWLKKNKPEAFDESVMREAVLQTGSEVGDLAMGLFGAFVEVPFGDLGEMIETTEALLAAGTPVIAEASFSYEGLFCSVDILKNFGGRRVELYEVKSSTTEKEIYFHDIAYQYYVLTQLGFAVERACLVHINNKYVRRGALDLQQLFHVADLTERVQEMQAQVRENLDRIEDYLSREDEPSDDIGPQCFSPYDCGFWGYCTRCLPKPNVFDVSALQKNKMFECYREGSSPLPI